MSKHYEAARLRLQKVAQPIADSDFPDAMRDAAVDVLVYGTTVEAAANFLDRVLTEAEGHRDTLAAQIQAMQVIHKRAARTVDDLEYAFLRLFEETGLASIDAEHHTLTPTSGRLRRSMKEKAALGAREDAA